jgi:hypothetical protein
LKIAETTD